MVNLGLLVLRLVVGGLLAGHGAQKLFGWFGGHGLEGTSGFMHSLGLRPGKPWATLGGVSEFGGGLLTVLGLLNPLGPVGIVGAMSMASATAHRGKPIWGTSGGAELPVVNIAAATAIGLTGSGSYSLDEKLGTRLPSWIFLGGVGAAVALIGIVTRGGAGEQQAEETAASPTPGDEVEQPA